MSPDKQNPLKQKQQLLSEPIEHIDITAHNVVPLHLIRRKFVQLGRLAKHLGVLAMPFCAAILALGF